MHAESAPIPAARRRRAPSSAVRLACSSRCASRSVVSCLRSPATVLTVPEPYAETLMRSDPDGGGALAPCDVQPHDVVEYLFARF